ncbi:C-C motif chemokine 8-like [Osmerus mordax]|uniref:C-C motif chemokine 8-like n=1 Tax=Osmerus mordax TaxID=8014 RepID=UPI0035107906
MASGLAFLLLAAIVCMSYTAAFSDVPVDCCLTTTDIPFNRRIRVQAYLLQTTDKGCQIDATVFITKNGLRLCTPHPSQSRWVAGYISLVDRRHQGASAAQHDRT